MLNDVKIEMIENQWSRAQFQKQRKELLNDQLTFGLQVDFLRCSSSETFSLLFNEILATIPKQPGLNYLRMKGSWDSNIID